MKSIEITKDATLGFYNDTGILNIPVKQFDNSRKIRIMLIDDSGKEYIIPDGAEINLKALKPDGKQINTSEVLEISENRIVLSVNEQMTIADGVVKCEMILHSNGNRITTSKFNLIVESAVHDNSHIEESTNYTDLLDTMNDAKLLIQECADTKKSLEDFQGILEDNESERNQNEAIRQEQEQNREEKTNKAIEDTNTAAAYAASVGDDLIKRLNNGEFKGDKGDQGDKGDKGEQGNKGDKGDKGTDIASVVQTTVSAADNGTNIITVTLSDGTQSTINIKNGSKGSTGATGTRGSQIFWGTLITGTSTSEISFSESGITSALINDLYLNTNTWNIYQCTTAGNASAAKWIYKGNITGNITITPEDIGAPNKNEVYLLKGGTSIPAGSDLKDIAYRSVGNYYCSANETAATLLNCPFSTAFLLKVEFPTGGNGQGYLRQIFIRFNDGKTVTRLWDPYINNGQWTGEQEVILRKDLTSINTTATDTYGTLGVSGSNTTVQDLLDHTINSFQTGCSTIAAAVTSMGVTTAANTSPVIIADNIKKIKTKPALSGNAVAANVLSGKTFYNTDSDTKVTGTMTDRSKVDATIGGMNTNYPGVPVYNGLIPQSSTSTGDKKTRFCLQVPAGYYNGEGYVGIEISSLGNAAAGNVLSGKTFTSSAGYKVTGTMKNWTGTPNKINNRRIANNRFEVAVDAGYHGCYWAGNSYEYMELSEVASTIGLTANKLLPGNTVCGVTSNQPGRTSNTGTANLSWAGNANGDPTNSLPSFVVAGDQLRVRIPYGWYGNPSYLTCAGIVKGNLNWSGSNTTYSVPAGYYTGGTLDSRPSYNAGYNAGKSEATLIKVCDVKESKKASVTIQVNNYYSGYASLTESNFLIELTCVALRFYNGDLTRNTNITKTYTASTGTLVIKNLGGSYNSSYATIGFTLWIKK